MTHEPHDSENKQIQRGFNNNMRKCKAFASESRRSVFKSAGLHSYCPQVNTSDSQQMNGQKGGPGT